MSDVTSSVTLIVPTVHHRAALFAQTLRYFSRLAWRGPVIVSDHSPEAHLDVIRDIVKPFSDLNITLRTDPPDAHFLTRLAHCAEQASTDYVHLHADDDFLVFATLPHLLSVMENDPGCAAAMGLNIHFEFGKGRMALLTKTSAPQADGFSRLLSQLEQFSSVLYALRRRSEFIDSVSYAQARCPDVQFWQYLETCQAALAGTVKVIDDLHYVRQIHPQKWSTQLIRGRSPDHFPSLILSPHFHPRVSAFRTALSDSCAARGIAVDHTALDDSLIHLLFRGFGVMGLPPRHSAAESSPPPEAVARRLENQDDPAAKALVQISEIVRAG